MSGNELIGLAICAATLVALPVAVALCIRLLRRGAPSGSALPTSPETSERLSGLENAVDAIAVEIERISESQRFVTKLLSERAAEPAHRSDAR